MTNKLEREAIEIAHHDDMSIEDARAEAVRRRLDRINKRRGENRAFRALGITRSEYHQMRGRADYCNSLREWMKEKHPDIRLPSQSELWNGMWVKATGKAIEKHRDQIHDAPSSLKRYKDAGRIVEERAHGDST